LVNKELILLKGKHKMTNNHSSVLNALQGLMIALGKHGLSAEQKSEITNEIFKLKGSDFEAAEILEEFISDE
jgi:hypothetical protein